MALGRCLLRKIIAISGFKDTQTSKKSLFLRKKPWKDDTPALRIQGNPYHESESDYSQARTTITVKIPKILLKDSVP